MPWVADFETTTQAEDCRVWAWGLSEIGDENSFHGGTTITELFDLFQDQHETLYFHNLKFDGEFVLYWLFENGFEWVDDRRKLENKTFTTLISDKGQFYSITICFRKKGRHAKTLVLYDSLKILPFAVSKIAKDFGLPINKLEIDYNAPRPVGYEPTTHEWDYIKHDVQIVARAIDIMLKRGMDKMTIGSDALSEYKEITGKKAFERLFPKPDLEIDYDVRQSYRGGFTYLKPSCANKDMGEGIVLDVNSLYPSVMHDRPLPFGEGIYFEGQYEPFEEYPLYVQMLKCRFDIKPGHIPTIQLKNNLAFVPTEYIEHSETENDDPIVLCLTNVDLELFFKHYDVKTPEYIGGWMYRSHTGLFTEYIDKWNAVKVQATKDGNKAMRTLAKLMLNSLYGKFSTNPRFKNKIPMFKNGLVKYGLSEEGIKDPIYIPVGTFITSWARYTTITAAQAVFDRFMYADTDSLHLKGLELPKELDISPTKLGAWKYEFKFSHAKYLRAKTYVEFGKEPDKEEEEYLKITCAGMPDACHKGVTFDNFSLGSMFPGKLQIQRVKGGIVLHETPYEIRDKKGKKVLTGKKNQHIMEGGRD